MRKRLPRADKKLIIPGDDKSPGDRPDSKPTVVLEEGVRSITATTLAEEHQGMMQVHKELQARDDTEDWGGGWTAFPEYAHILRNPDGSIASVVPLAEIPGVKMHDKEPDIPPVIAPEKPEKVPMTRAQRHKFISVLAQRMFYYYKQLAKDYPGYHPFRDGLPDLPAGAPKNLQPKGETLYPATDAQIYDWLYKFCGQRATIINKKKHGAGIQDMAVRIE